jgi:threonine synthase
MKIESLGDAEKFVLDALFDEFPQSVREEAVFRLLSRFPQDEPVPVVKKGPFHYLELFHGKTGAFKDVALSMLPVFMRYSAQGKKVLVLTATSGDTGSAAMQGFAGVEGTEIVVFYPATGTSRIQRLQMTTPAEANVHAVGIKGNFDDAQGAVKKMFSNQVFAAEAARAGVTLSSANSINTGRLIPQIAYYTYAAGKLGGEFDCVVPSGNFGNILAAYYAKRLGAPIKKLVVASNVNDVLARFVKTGVYDPGERFTVTNSPSMDIRRSSNVERLLWELNFEGDEEAACAETSRLMKSLEEKNRYELSDAAKKRLFELFEGGVASVEETEMEMCRVYEKDGYLVDPHTAVASCVARKLGYPKEGRPCLVAATATAYKFPETSMNAFRKNVLLDMPENFRDLETLPVVQKEICEVSAMPDAVRRYFA